MVLGKLTSTMDDGKVVVVSFTVQVIFETPVGDDVEAKHWQIWIVGLQSFSRLLPAYLPCHIWIERECVCVCGLLLMIPI